MILLTKYTAKQKPLTLKRQALDQPCLIISENPDQTQNNSSAVALRVKHWSENQQVIIWLASAWKLLNVYFCELILQ